MKKTVKTSSAFHLTTPWLQGGWTSTDPYTSGLAVSLGFILVLYVFYLLNLQMTQILAFFEFFAKEMFVVVKLFLKKLSPAMLSNLVNFIFNHAAPRQIE